MPTVTKVWTFDSDEESWGGIDSVFVGTDGDPSPGCLSVGVGSGSINFSASSPLFTFTSIGVSSGATLTKASIVFELRVISNGNVTAVSGCRKQLNKAMGGGTVYDTTFSFSETPGAWLTIGDGTLLSLAGSPVPSDNVAVAIFGQLSSGGFGPDFVLYIDTVTLVVEFTESIIVDFTAQMDGVGTMVVTNFASAYEDINSSQPGGLLAISGIGTMAVVLGPSTALAFGLRLAGEANNTPYGLANYGNPTPITVDTPVPGHTYIVDVPVIDIAGFLKGNTGQTLIERGGDDFNGDVMVTAIELYGPAS